MKRLLYFILIALFLAGCKSDNDQPDEPPIAPVADTYSATVKPEKGPFSSGSVVTAQPLNCNNLKTQGSAIVQYVNSQGAADIDGISSQCLQLIATGQFFKENTGQVTNETFTLSGYAYTSGSTNIAVNIPVSLISLRVKLLVERGASLQDSQTQAQNELISSFGYPSFQGNFFDLSLSGGGVGDSFLFAVSSAFMGYGTTAIISEKIDLFQIDFEDGTADVSELILNANNVDFASNNSNLKTWYSDRSIAYVEDGKLAGLNKLRDSDSDGIRDFADGDDPAGFTLISQSNIATNATVTSNTTAISGLTVGGVTKVVATNGTIVKNGADAVNVTIVNGDTLALKVTAPATLGTTKTATLKIGVTDYTFSVSTNQPDKAFEIPDTGAATTSLLSVNGFLTAYPIEITSPFTSRNIGVKACDLQSMSIYSDLNGIPDAKLAGAVNLNQSLISGYSFGDATQNFTAGRYWLAVRPIADCNPDLYEPAKFSLVKVFNGSIWIDTAFTSNPSIVILR
jgi:hypothetical protein